MEFLKNKWQYACQHGRFTVHTLIQYHSFCQAWRRVFLVCNISLAWAPLAKTLRLLDKVCIWSIKSLWQGLGFPFCITRVLLVPSPSGFAAALLVDSCCCPSTLQYWHLSCQLLLPPSPLDAIATLPINCCYCLHCGVMLLTNKNITQTLQDLTNSHAH
jgi:hypothetical protein